MKKTVGVIFGGQSGEHEVSLMSATSILRVIDRDKFDVVHIGISKNGNWYLFKGDIEDIQKGNWEKNSIKAFLPPDSSYKGIVTLQNGVEKIHKLDVVFPVLHGPRGEDGTIQGLFELAGIPYVSCGVLSSAMCMDKVITKKMLEHESLPIAEWTYYYDYELLEEEERVIKEIETRFGYPCFVKPANLGSSVGVTKAKNQEELIEALKLAAEYDRKIVVEEFIDGREIEISVLGNDNPRASITGEIIPCHEFYDYTAKYFDNGQSKLLIPAPIPEEVEKTIQDFAIKAFKALGCEGMARVDFFYQESKKRVLINELNTIPGFTKISMYPKLWEASGLKYKDLITELINLAIERHEKLRR